MASQWDSLADKINKKHLDVTRAAIIGTENTIIQNSVVDKGFFINSWMTSLDKTIDSRTSANPSGSDSVNQAAQVGLKLSVGKTVFFTSNLPYSFKLEYLGHSDRMPNGTLRIGVAQFPEIFKRKAREMK